MTKTREQRAEEYVPKYKPGTHPQFFKYDDMKYAFMSGAQSEAELWAEKVRICQEALEFYADSNSWEWTTAEGTYDGCGCTDFDTMKEQHLGGSLIQVGGRRAREALVKLKEDA